MVRMSIERIDVVANSIELANDLFSLFVFILEAMPNFRVIICGVTLNIGKLIELLEENMLLSFPQSLDDIE